MLHTDSTSELILDKTTKPHHPYHRQADTMLTLVNGFGPFQWICIACFCLMVVPASYQVFLVYFLTLRPQWKCATNSTWCPLNGTFDATDKLRCSIPRSEWMYVKPRHYSIVTQYDIYCEREWLLDLTSGIFFLGASVGGLILGKLADNIGRKHVLFISLGALISIGFASAFSPNIELLILLRVLSGVFYAGTLGQMIVMAVELVSPERRSIAGNLVWMFYCFAPCVMSLKAYLIEEWSMLVVVCTVPYCVVLLCYTQVPESVRWLELKGKTERLNDVWEKIAKRNERVLTANHHDVDVEYDALPSGGDGDAAEAAGSSFGNLFRPLRFGLRTWVQAFAWLTTSLVYYGLSLTADSLGGSIYRNFAMVSIMECPGLVCGAYLSNRFGRKRTAIVPIFLSGVTCVLIPFAPTTGELKLLKVMLGMLGKFFISICYSCIYVWSAEIFPTRDRAKGIGFVQMFEMIGGTCAPFVVKKLLTVNTFLPFFLLGTCSTLASGLMMFLPETRSKHIG